ncbi:MAG: 3-hydroxyacyl-CoA dehydrogenase NAD-binding domain-containing protein [Sphingomonadaceae bacterium]
MSTVAVIGAGQMGSGIAQTAAQAGYDVMMVDVDLAIVEKAKDKIGKGLDRLVTRDKITAEEAAATLSRIQPIGDYGPMKDAEFIIEAATEREDIKMKIIEQAGQVLGDNAIMASNTSSIPITRMGAKAVAPDRFIGMHFFNPVPVMGLIEVIPGLATSEETTKRARAFGENLGKQIVIAGDDPGFVVNRILVPMINEAIFVLGNGMGTIEEIDMGCRIGLNHPMGPLELADFVGIDTLYEIVQVLYKTTGDSKYRPAPLLVKYFEAGWWGRKAGRGFYDYSGDVPVPTR